MRRRLLSNNGLPPEIPVQESLAGDAVFYNPELDEIFIRRDKKDWQKKEIPIGVVVIPGSHNVYGNGACGVMALMSASCSTPDIGLVSNDLIRWGQYGDDISELYNYNGCSSYGNYDDWIAVRLTGNASYLPSDRSDFGVNIMNKLPGSDQNCWYFYNNNYYHIPSPYLNDESRNPDYYNTEIGEGNVLSDFKGKENTAQLISKATSQPDWKTSSSITNNEDSGYSPAACACWRYYTVGTKQGDWYLPAMGELGYTEVRFKKINDTISALQSYFGKMFTLLKTSIEYWSSSEGTNNAAWRLEFLHGYVHQYIKADRAAVTPFLQLKPKPKFVDMGLSVDWAECNIGANSPEEYGWYFQWGDVEPFDQDRRSLVTGIQKSFDWANYKWCNGSQNTITKYCTQSSYGTVDNKLILDPEDDAAHVHLGSNYRMPTVEEFQEMLDACSNTWVTDYKGTGVNGRLFTLKTDPSKTLFFPASGSFDGKSWASVGSYGWLWAGSLNSTLSYAGRLLLLSLNGCYTNSVSRYTGRPVRAVRPKK